MGARDIEIDLLDIYKELEKAGQNNAKALTEWLKQSKLFDNAHETEEKARKLFEDAIDKEHVEFVKFKEVVCAMAAEQSQTLEEAARKLTKDRDRVLYAIEQAAKAAMDAFQKAMNEEVVNKRT